MNKKTMSRRTFINRTSLSIAGTAVASGISLASNPKIDRILNKPAILGGTPVREKNWPEWPLWDPQTDEEQIIKVLRSGVWSRNNLVAEFEKKWAEILQQLISTFYEKKLDLAFLVTKCKSDSGFGRVILSESNQPIAIVESIDIAKYTLLGQMWDKTKRGSLNSAEAERMIRRFLKSEKKIQNALEPLWSKIINGEDLCHVDIAGMTKGKYPSLRIHEGLEISTKRLQKCNLANQSIYLFSAPALFEALNELSSNNAQKEEYLTDIAAILAAKGTYKLGTVSLENPHQVMAFNSQKELREIDAYLRTKHHPADT